MKKSIFTSKLNLKKETVSNLNLAQIKGGIVITYTLTDIINSKSCPKACGSTPIKG